MSIRNNRNCLDFYDDILVSVTNARMLPNLGRNTGRLLNSCASLPDLKRIHALLITHGLSSRLPIATKLISLAASLSPTIHYARHLFDSIPHGKDSFLYNTLLRAYSDLGPLHQVFPLYTQMHQLSLSPDRFTFPFVLRSCGVVLNLRQGKEAHCNVIKTGFDSNVFVDTALVFMYSCCGEISDSELIFRAMDNRNVVSWTAMIAGYVQNSVFGKAMAVFRSMVADEIQPNEVTVVSILPACNGPRCLDAGKSIHGFAVRSGLDSFTALMNALVAMYGKCGDLEVARCVFDGMAERNLVSWNTMIAAYEQSGNGKKAIELFQRMVANEKAAKFDAVTLVSLVSACTGLGALNTGKWAHQLARSQGLDNDLRVRNALLDMYAKCGSLDVARDVFEKLRLKGVVSWSAMIGGYAAHGHAKEAVELFDRMRTEGIKPNNFTFTSVLAACSHSGLVEEGRKHFDSMKRDYGITPTIEHCACMVDLLGRAGMLHEAYEFVMGMEVKPDTGVWGALVGACRIHGNVEMAEAVAKDILRVEPHNVMFHVLLSNIYADVGRWEDAARMRGLIKKQELKKMPGCSSVETVKSSSQDTPFMEQDRH